MTTVLLAPPTAPAEREATVTRRVGSPGPTLDELIAGAWTGLRAGQPVACPICAETMEPQGASSGVSAGACTGCGSELS